MDHGVVRPRWPWLVPPFLAVLVVGPLLLGRGFGLVGDMVFVPRQPWKPAWYGGDGAVPRAVPGDAWVSLATHVVPGDLVQKSILVLLLAAAGWGVLRLLDDLPAPAALAGAVLYQWNPFVYERLGIGHWALLCGYAALPWCVVGARRVVEQGGRALPWIVLPLGLAAATSPTGGVLASIVVVGVVGAGLLTRRRGFAVAAVAAGTALVLNLPWLLPGLLNGNGLTPDPEGAAAFAARADTPWGLGPSLASLGAVWKTAVHAPERASWVVSGVGLLLTVAALAGLAAALRSPRTADRATIAGLVAPALTLLAAAWFLSTAAGRPAMEWLITEVPGGGLARDAQKWVAPFALVLAVGVGHTVAVVARRLPAGARPVVLGAAVLLPVALLPSLAWGLAGFVKPADYPAEWHAVADVLAEADAAEARVLVLPFSVYRRYDWAHQRAVLDPAPRFFPGQLVVDDRLGVDDRVVGGDAADGAVVREAIAENALPEAVELLGVRWVLIQKGTPGEGTWPADSGTVVHDGPELRLVDVGSGEPATLSPWRSLYLAVTVGVGLVVGGCAVGVSVATVTRMYAGRRRGSMRSVGGPDG